MTRCRRLLMLLALAGCGRGSPGVTIDPEPARTGPAVVSGVVREAQTERRVANVQVAAHDDARGRTFVTRTADDGLYVLTGLDPGTYTIQVQGFAQHHTVTTRTGLERFRADFNVERERSASSDGPLPTATLSGVVTHRDTKERLPDAIIVLQSPALHGTRETQTNANGLYAFHELPAGTYTVQALVGVADASKILTLAADGRFRANFAVDPDAAARIGCRLMQPASRRLDASMFSIEPAEARRLGIPTTTIHH